MNSVASAFPEVNFVDLYIVDCASWYKSHARLFVDPKRLVARVDSLLSRGSGWREQLTEELGAPQYSHIKI